MNTPLPDISLLYRCSYSHWLVAEFIGVFNQLIWH